MKTATCATLFLVLVASCSAFEHEKVIQLGEGNPQQLAASKADVSGAVSSMDDMERLEVQEEQHMGSVKKVLNGWNQAEGAAAIETAQNQVKAAMRQEAEQQVHGEHSLVSLKQGMKDMASEEKDLLAHPKGDGEVGMIQKAEKEVNQVSKTLEQGLEGHATSDRLSHMSQELGQIHSAMSDTEELGEGMSNTDDGPEPQFGNAPGDVPSKRAQAAERARIEKAMAPLTKGAEAMDEAPFEPRKAAQAQKEEPGALSLLQKVKKAEAGGDVQGILKKVMAEEAQVDQAEHADVSEIDSLEKMLK
jgi:hypothetical protein